MDGNSNNTIIGENIICKNCGKSNHKSNSICIYCGTNLKTSLNKKDEIHEISQALKKNKQIIPQQKLKKKEEEKTNLANIDKTPNKELATYQNNVTASNNEIHTQFEPKPTNNQTIVEENKTSNSTINNNQKPITKEKQTIASKKKKSPIAIILGIISVIISVVIPISFVVFIILATISLFKEKTNDYGKTVFIGYGVLYITAIVLMIIMFGMCIASFG